MQIHQIGAKTEARLSTSRKQYQISRWGMQSDHRPGVNNKRMEIRQSQRANSSTDKAENGPGLGLQLLTTTQQSKVPKSIADMHASSR